MAVWIKGAKLKKAEEFLKSKNIHKTHIETYDNKNEEWGKYSLAHLLLEFNKHE